MINFPEKYYVKCNSLEEANKVMEIVYGKKKYAIAIFNYILIRNIFIRSGRFCS